MLFSKLLLFSTLNTMFPLIFATANSINEVKKCHIAEMLYILHLQKRIIDETTKTFLGNTPTATETDLGSKLFQGIQY